MAASKSRRNVPKILSVFRIGTELNLKPGENYNFTDLAVTSENQLLLCNYHPSYPKVYIYKDCNDYENEIICPSYPYGIAVIPDTDTAVVTLPGEDSVQFINTANASLGNKVKLTFWCNGIAATKDTIFVGGDGVVHVLDINGAEIREVRIGGTEINCIHYDDVKKQLLCRYHGGLRCVTLDGKSIYQYKVSGKVGLAVDEEGQVYLSHEPYEIHQLSSDGKFCNFVVEADDCLEYPYALSFDNKFTQLFVVNGDLSKVTIINCK